MKLIIVVPDGMCDTRYPALKNCSPAEMAHTPGLDEVVRYGRVGLVKTMYDGLPLGSLVGFLGLLGYEPPRYFPVGRSIFEARALGLHLEPCDLVSRCNIVCVSEAGLLSDFTAGQISNEAAEAYLSSLDIPAPFEIHHDLSYRSVLIYRDCALDESALDLTEPHEYVGHPIQNILPRYEQKNYAPFVDLILKSRRDGLMLWPWGASRVRDFPPVSYRLFMVTALSFLSGMAVSMGGAAVIPPGTTGYLGSDLGAKLNALLENWDHFDVGVIHCNAPDEEAHLGHLAGKVQAIEDIDRQVIQPLLEFLATSGEPYRLLICPDHYTCCDTGKHAGGPVPYAVMGYGIQPNHSLRGYSEAEIAAQTGTITDSHHLVALLRE